MNRLIRVAAVLLLLLAAFRSSGAREDPDVLSEEEVDKLREVQDPSKRIELYVEFAQARLDRFEGFRAKPADPRYDNGAYLESLLSQFIAVNEELKNWIDYQYQRNGDMRGGLRALLERGPHQLAMLRHIQQTPDGYAAAYASTLRDALEDLQDTLNGATRALADQQKRFPELEEDEKSATRDSKQRIKDEKKRAKEAQKVRKKEQRKRVPGEFGED